MAKITVFTAARMAAIEAASIVSGAINSSGRLILSRNDGGTVDAGPVLGTVPIASTTVAGLVPLATGTEATTGTDSSKAVTPVALASAFAAKLIAATTAVAGIVRLATTTEAATGTATNIAVTPAGLAGLVGTGGPAYRFGGTAVFTATGAFTKASYPGLRAVRARAIGCGGGAGPAVGPIPSGAHSVGGGGGAGGYAEGLVLASALAASETVTIGSAGVGGTAGSGSAGQACSFGAWVVAGGGNGGSWTGSNTLMVGSPGGLGGVGTAGDILGTGEPGGMGWGYATLAIGGQGGSTLLGAGGASVYTGGNADQNPGQNGRGYGAGGSGAANNQNAPGNTKGGDGSKGIVIVELLY